jgi:fibronectin-binding autotransporter adhesin
MFCKGIFSRFLSAFRLKLVVSAIGVVVALAYTTSTAWAAITWSGDVNPLAPHTWISSTTGYIGKSSAGILEVNGGCGLLSFYGYLGYDSGSTGTVTVTGAGSKWTNSGRLYVGYSGSGTLTVADGGAVTAGTIYASLSNLSGNGTITVKGAVLDTDLVFDGNHGLQQTLAFGTGGTLNLTLDGSGALGAGYKGAGSLRIADGVAVASSSGYLGYYPGSTGTATVTGTGSKWTNSGFLYVLSGIAILNIEAGGLVSNTNGYLSNYSGSTTATVTGTGSKWINSGDLYVGNHGSAILNIQAGGQVTAKTLTLANNSYAYGTCNINNGGTLLVATITKGSGTANFNWNDGIIQNYDATTDMTIPNSNNLVLKLAATGTHAFNIDLNRTGTVDAILSDATSGGSLNKIGAGTLILTAANTYSGATTVEEGRFKVTGSILNTSGISIGESGILELAKSSDSATAANMPISNAGTLLISAGSQTVGAITGTGITQINAGATLTAQSIIQNTLSIGGTGAGFAADSSTISQVPEPGTIALLGMGAFGLLAWAWRRSCKAV